MSAFRRGVSVGVRKRGRWYGSGMTQAGQSGGVVGAAIFSYSVETHISCISLPYPGFLRHFTPSWSSLCCESCDRCSPEILLWTRGGTRILNSRGWKRPQRTKAGCCLPASPPTGWAVRLYRIHRCACRVFPCLQPMQCMLGQVSAPTLKRGKKEEWLSILNPLCIILNFKIK